MHRFTKFKRAVQIVSLAVVLSFAATSRADFISQTYELNIFNDGTAAANSDLSYTVVVSNELVALGQARFRITNTSTALDSVLTAVYWDDGVLLGISEVINQSGDGITVDFQQDLDEAGGGVSPGNLPGGNTIGFETSEQYGALFSADAENPGPMWGLGNGEYVEVIFDLINGGTIDDVIAQMNDLTIRVGAHIQVLGVDGEGSASAVSIPAPGAVLLGALGLGLVGWVRRRFA